MYDPDADLFKSYSCWREAWGGGKCVWHAGIRDKKTSILRPSRIKGTASRPADPSDRWLGRGGERLDGAILREADLTGLQFRGCTLFGSDLSKARMTGVDCSNADFRSSNCKGLVANQAIFESAGFREVNLSEAKLSGANLVDADLRKANLQGTDLSETNLRGADLRRANLEGANLQGADLTGANCFKTTFSKASVVEADLQGANLESAAMTGLQGIRADFRDANLVDADLGGATLKKAELPEAICRGADFSDADLTGTDCTEIHAARASFEDAVLERARLNRADLYDADFTGARFYGAVMGGAQINEGTAFDHRIAYDPTEEGEIVTDGGGDTDTVDDLTKAAGTYRILEQLARENELSTLRSRSDLRRRDIRRRKYRQDGDWIRWLRSSLVNASVRYGEEPWRVGAAGLAVIVLSALLYPLGLVALPDGGTLSYPSAPADIAAVLGESLYFSAVTFTTGTTAYDPVGLGRILAALEGFAGLIVFALLVYAFARRATQ